MYPLLPVQPIEATFIKSATEEKQGNRLLPVQQENTTMSKEESSIITYSFYSARNNRKEHELHKNHLIGMKGAKSIYFGVREAGAYLVIQGINVFDKAMTRREASMLLGTNDITFSNNNMVFKDHVSKNFQETYEISVGPKVQGEERSHNNLPRAGG